MERTTSAADEPLIQPLVGEDEARLDDEKDLVAEAEPAERDREADGSPPPAEEAALHLEAEPGAEV